MEPLRGGRLARLTPEEAAPLKELRPEEGAPAWAFRFLQTVPGVVVVLSGMSDLAQTRDNLATFATEAPLSDKEWETVLEVGGA